MSFDLREVDQLPREERRPREKPLTNDELMNIGFKMVMDGQLFRFTLKEPSGKVLFMVGFDKTGNKEMKLQQ